MNVENLLSRGIPLPPLNGLRAFEVAGRRLNFRAAADELGVTQGAVAQQVRRLEEVLGLRLFERLPKGLAFTAAGRSYHAQVGEAFGLLQRATETLRPEPMRVTISVTPSLASRWLIPRLPDFSRQHPGVDLRILATEGVSSFAADGIDLAIRQAAPPFGASLEAQLLFAHEVIAVAAPSLVAGKPRPLGAATLRALPPIHDTHDLWPQFSRTVLGQEDGVSERGLRVNQTALALDAALDGQGVALAPMFLVAQDLAQGRLVALTDKTLKGQKDFYLLARLRTQRRAAVDQVIAWLVAQAAT